MSSDWQRNKLDHLIEIKHGFAFKGEFFSEKSTPYQLTTPGNFAVGGGFKPGKGKFYSGPFPDDYVLYARDLIVTMTDLSKAADTLGYSALVPETHGTTWLHNQRIGRVNVKPGAPVSRDFIHYLMRSPEYRHWVVSTATGSTVKHTSPTRICEYEFMLPPVLVQKEIAETLGALDDQIILLRESNETLEAIAHAIFKSWFVDFDPVKAKAAGLVPGGIDEATAALFPGSFEESALGPVPQNWSITTLIDHVVADRGLSYKGAGLCGAEEGVPMHNLNSVLEGGGYKYAGLKFYKGDYKDRHLISAGEIIVANTEQGHDHKLIGFPALVPECYPKGILSHHLYRVRIREESWLTRQFIFHMLMANAVREQIISCANGSTVNMLKSAGLEIPKFPCPPVEILKAFDSIATPIRSSIEANVQEIKTLSELRDTLLPRLISGKLRLPEITQEAVEMA